MTGPITLLRSPYTEQQKKSSQRLRIMLGFHEASQSVSHSDLHWSNTLFTQALYSTLNTV